jgi:hypothetical protein
MSASTILISTSLWRNQKDLYDQRLDGESVIAPDTWATSCSWFAHIRAHCLVGAAKFRDFQGYRRMWIDGFAAFKIHCFIRNPSNKRT